MVYALERQREQTKPTSTILRWQKHAALRSTCSCTGNWMCFRVLRPGKNVVCGSKQGSALSLVLRGKGLEGKLTMRYCSRPDGWSSLKYAPEVRCEACWRKTVSSPRTLHTSTGMLYTDMTVSTSISTLSWLWATCRLLG